MIVVIDHGADCLNERYTYARDGIVKDTLTRAEAEELLSTLSAELRPRSTGAVTPAKARMRPPIMRYPTKAANK